jgi:hypothetical protein|tara:strand:+ start:326 stop:661 length:336 start_codon:yes stop_codon:yes gene_type:complete
MKKLFIVALFATLLSNAQKEFQGTWLTPGSSYETIILANNDLVVDIISYSFEEDNILIEKIITQSKNTITTFVYNPRNEYTLKLKYKVIDKNTLECVFTGDHNETLIMTKK